MAGFSFNHVGRGLGPKWRALRDINIGDELVCNYASEHFTRFDADVFRIDNPVAHEKPLRPLKTPKRHKVDKLKQGTGVQCSQEKGRDDHIKYAKTFISFDQAAPDIVHTSNLQL